VPGRTVHLPSLGDSMWWNLHHLSAAQKLRQRYLWVNLGSACSIGSHKKPEPSQCPRPTATLTKARFFDVRNPELGQESQKMRRHILTTTFIAGSLLWALSSCGGDDEGGTAKGGSGGTGATGTGATGGSGVTGGSGGTGVTGGTGGTVTGGAGGIGQGGGGAPGAAGEAGTAGTAGAGGAVCSGTAEACAGRTTQDCASGFGCTLTGGSGDPCTGSATACSTEDTVNKCVVHLGCTWNGTTCGGSTSACTAMKFQAGCEEAGCTWDTTGLGTFTCGGTETACGDLNENQCDLQPGCSL
jgi:hypothetical protein